MTRRRRIWRTVVDVAAIAGCLGTILFGWLAVRVARDAITDARQLASDSGALDRPELRLSIGSQPLDSDSQNRLFLGFPFTDSKTINVGKVPFFVHNNGKKTARDLVVIDRFPKLARSQLHDALTLRQEGFFPKKDEVQSEIKEIGNFSYIYYSVSHVNPDHGFLLYEPMLLTRTHFDVPLDIGDGSKIVAKINVAFQQNITISATDQVTHDYDVDVETFDCRTDQELLDKTFQQLSGALKTKRAGLSLPLRWLATLESKAFVAFATPTTLSNIEGARLNQVEFKPEAFKEITVYDHSRTRSVFIFTLVIIATLALALLFVFSLRRRRARVVAV